jgi:hypothetical protein
MQEPYIKKMLPLLKAHRWSTSTILTIQNMLLSLFISAALLASSQTAEAACPKYVDAANEAATNLQSQFFVNGAYGSQSVWIGAVDTVYLLQRT